jgi:hypothetical protein
MSIIKFKLIDPNPELIIGGSMCLASMVRVFQSGKMTPEA